MELQGFDYLNEKTQLENLRSQNFGLWLKSQKDLLEKTKFSLSEITEYLEHGICSLTQGNWTIRRIAFLDEENKTVDLAYYAVDSDFDTLLNSLVRKGSKVEKEVENAIRFLKENDLIFLLGKKDFHFQKRTQIFTKIKEIENKQENYLENNFFKFPISWDQLYQIIIDHINRKNNQTTYQKSH